MNKPKVSVSLHGQFSAQSNGRGISAILCRRTFRGPQRGSGAERLHPAGCIASNERTRGGHERTELQKREGISWQNDLCLYSNSVRRCRRELSGCLPQHGKT